MNILAHLVLSGDSEGVRFGNFIGDAVKGRHYLDWEHEIQAGLRLHRAIDSFTDTHEEALIVRRILAQELGLYAPIALDILFDYLLSELWEEFYDFDKAEFIRNTYEQLEKRKNLMPDNISLMFEAMKNQDWLTAYSTESGIRRALRGLSMRIKGNPELEKAFGIFEANRNKVILHFRNFYSDLMSHCEQMKIEFLSIE